MSKQKTIQHKINKAMGVSIKMPENKPEITLFETPETISEVPVNTFEAVTANIITTNGKEVSLAREQDINNAYEESKSTIKNIIKTGEENLERVSELAKDLDSPRGYEVVAGVMKSLISANKRLLEIQKEMRDLDEPNKITASGKEILIDKAVFVGTTASLQMLMKEEGKKRKK